MAGNPKAHTEPISLSPLAAGSPAAVPSKATLYDAEGNPLNMEGHYSGKSVFLIAGGPSFASLDHSLLRQPGVCTMSINNGPKSFRPNLWTYVDPPDKWLRSIWLDPLITKFACIRDRNKHIWDSDKWEKMDVVVRDCPNVFYYERNADKFDAEGYLKQPTFWWGQSRDTVDEFGQKAGRSVFMLAVRLAHYLGFRRVYLLGVDFKMDEQHKYHFDQDKHGGSIRGNNSTYGKMQRWFEALRPHFEADGFNIYNCNEESGLTAFNFKPYAEAVKEVLHEFGDIDIANERSHGLYEKNMGEKKEKKFKVYENAKEKATETRTARARVKSPVTGKKYAGRGKATVEAEGVASGKGRTKVGSEVNARINAYKVAQAEAAKQAAEQAKQQAEEDAIKRMKEAEKN